MVQAEVLVRPALVTILLFGCSSSPSSPADTLGVAPVDATDSSPPAACDAEPAEGPFLDDGVRVDGALTCGAAWHAFAGPAGATLRFTVEGLDAGTATVEVRDWNDALLGAVSGLAPGDSFTRVQPWSGELKLRLVADGADGAHDAPYAVRVTCEAGCDRAWTRYPLVLMHGMAGDDAWLDVVGYFWGVPEPLGEAGYLAYTPAVAPFHDTEARAAQWRAALDELRATGRMRRFNLIGHSQGGLDARYVASLLDPDGDVASVTTIGTPHHGTLGADLAAGVLGDLPLTGALVDGVLDAYAAWTGATGDQDLVAQLEGFSTAAMADFNAVVVDRPDVYYASWAGETCGALDAACIASHGGEVVLPMFAPTHAALLLVEGPNDGVVSVASAAWGELRGVLHADHGDEIGQIGGITAPGFDHEAFYLDEAAHLAALGL